MFLASYCDLEGRTTGAFTNSNAGSFVGDDEIALLTKVEMADDRHADTEVGYLLSALGGWVGAVVGRDSAGTQFAVVMQHGPVGAEADLSTMADQALEAVAGLIVVEHYWLDLMELVSHYMVHGAGIVEPKSLGMVPLLHGLISEMAGYEPAEYIERFPSGCAYPDRDHQCEGSVVNDVLRAWQDGQQSYRPGPEA